MPLRTEEAFSTAKDTAGFFHSGDQVELDGDGFGTFKGRYRDPAPHIRPGGFHDRATGAGTAAGMFSKSNPDADAEATAA